MTRIVVHDYGGYPFAVQLSRALASRGNDVLHLYPSGFRAPKAQMYLEPTDSQTLLFAAVVLDEPAYRDQFGRRLLQERRYGAALAKHIRDYAPDAVISANTPLSAQAAAFSATGEIGGRFVFWLQDLYSLGIVRLLGRRTPALGRLVGARFTRLERSLLRGSNAVVAITDGFLPILSTWGIPPERISVIENWAPLHDVEPGPKVNDWSRRHGLDDVKVLLYAGTLGRKHDPRLLVDLARNLPAAKVVVVAEGYGADWLRRSATATDNLMILPPQPPDCVPEVYASADVLLALLERDAAEFSVPSKVLSYLTAGRAILASMPEANLATRTIRRAKAGVVVEAGDSASFSSAARELIDKPELRTAYAEAGRLYAEATFNIESITDRFAAIIGEEAEGRTFGPLRQTDIAREPPVDGRDAHDR